MISYEGGAFGHPLLTQKRSQCDLMNKISTTFRALALLVLAAVALRGADLYGAPTAGAISAVVGTSGIISVLSGLMLKRMRDHGEAFPFAKACLVGAVFISVSAIGLVATRAIT